MNKEQELLSDITIFQKYAKYIPSLNRRETWSEIVYRYLTMMETKYPTLKDEIWFHGQAILEKKVLPSMRALQFAGVAIEKNPARVYNCCFLPIDDYRSFSETMFLLLGGTGVGYSVQFHHIDKLPEIKIPTKEKRFLIGDSIEGWADAVKALVKAYLKGGAKPRFDYSDIRHKGVRLITAGGKAPGPEPLKLCLAHIESIFARKKAGEKLCPIEAHDIQCHIANAVLAGGIRRAAMISLFSFDDEEMLTSKFGNWWELNEQRGRSNNSAAIVRNRIKPEEFESLWSKIEASNAGEPGIYFTNNSDWGTNPCFTGETIVAVADGRNGVTIKELASQSLGEKSFPVYSAREKNNGQIGWKTEIKNAVAFKTGVKKVIEIVLSNGTSFKCTKDHQLALPNNTWVSAKDSFGLTLEKFHTYTPEYGEGKYRHINSFTNGYSYQHRMIWEDNNGIKPKGFQIDHKISKSDDFIDNLQLLSDSDHNEKNALSLSDSNPMDRLKNREKTINNLSCSTSVEKNPNYGGLSDYELIEIGKICQKQNGFISSIYCKSIDKRFPLSFSKNRFKESFGYFKNVCLGIEDYVKPVLNSIIESEKTLKTNFIFKDEITVIDILDNNEIEDVYDLTVEDNHNFYILTKGDKNFENSEGILVHNCAEIALRSYQFCNLCEMNVSDIKSESDLFARATAATFFGTLQAGFTDFHYLREVWKRTTEKDALIGIGMTGIASGAIDNYDLKKLAVHVKDQNKIYSKNIGINSAARCTTVKPSGTTSCVLGTSSGIHAWHNDFYIRRMRINKSEDLYKYLIKTCPSVVKDEFFNPTKVAVIEIPQKAPEGSVIRTESVFTMLDRVMKFNIDWVQEGHRNGDNTNNVSATASIKPQDWKSVGSVLWNTRHKFNGMSVLPHDNGSYVQAPFEDITEEEFNKRVKDLGNIDLSMVIEEDDITAFGQEIACAGGACEV